MAAHLQRVGHEQGTTNRCQLEISSGPYDLNLWTFCPKMSVARVR